VTIRKSVGKLISPIQESGRDLAKVDRQDHRGFAARDLNLKEIAASLAILSLALGGLPLFRRQSTRATAVILLIPKYLGTALAPYAALARALGAALGLAYGSGLAIAADPAHVIGC